MRRWVKGATTTAILIAIAAGAIATAPPSAWREAEDVLRRHLRSVEAMARPAADRSAQWFERQTHALRDRLGGSEAGAGDYSAARQKEPVRVAQAASAVTCSARVIDGDTLDVGGVRIWLQGIDAPESGQSCRAGGKRWACGREATRALAGRIGGRSVECQERDRDRYGRLVATCSASGEGSQRVDGRARLGVRLPAVLECVRWRGIGGTGGEAGRVARRGRSALGVAQGQAPRRDADGGSAGERRTVQHQGQHRQERHAHLPRARRALLRADSNQHIEGGAVVLLRERGTRGGMAPLEAIIRMPSGPRTGAHGLGSPRQSRVNGTALLGRYRTFPGARVQLYSKPLARTVDLRHLRGSPLARSL